MALQFNRVVKFLEVHFQSAGWVSNLLPPEPCSCCTLYTALGEQDAITIIRDEDAKQLTLTPPRGYQVMICEDIVSFESDQPFK